MWRLGVPASAGDHRVLLMDHVGCGGADRNAYQVERYSSLQGCADDDLDIALRSISVCHSVSANDRTSRGTCSA